MSKIKRQNLKKRIVAMMLTLALVLSGFGAIGVQPVHAETLSGTYGNWKWTLNDDGKLTIEANGVSQATLSASEAGTYDSYIPWGNKASNQTLANTIRTNTKSIEIKSNVVLGAQQNGLFKDFINLTTTNAGSWDVSRVGHTGGMFQGCKNLTEIDLSGWGAKFTPAKNNSEYSLNNMFNGCSKLKTVNVSGWDMQYVKDIGNMFYGCGALTKVTGIEDWTTTNLVATRNMFTGATSLTSIDLGNWDVRKLQDMSSMFYGCTKLSTVIIGDGNFSALKDMGSAFYGCKSLTTLSFLENWDVSKVEIIGSMFASVGANSVDLKNWNTSSATYMASMFKDSSINEIWLGPAFKNSSSNQAVAHKTLCEVSDPNNPVLYSQGSPFKNGAGHYVVGKEVKFDSNGGSGNMQSQGFPRGGDPMPLNENAFSRANYSFTGWNSKADGTGTTFTDKELVQYSTSILTDKMTLYAQWRYEGDDNNDGIRDRFQIFVNYVSSNTEQGSVPDSSKSEIVNAKNCDNISEEADFTGVKTSGSSVETKGSYLLDYWSFTPNGDSELRSSSGVFPLDNEVGGSTITITAYFAEDSAGGSGTNTGDGVPDKYQVFVTYETEDSEKGTITGAAADEPYTAQKVNGLYESTVSFTTVGGRTATPKDGYVFSKWTNNFNDATDKDGKITFTGVPGGTTIKLTAEFKSKKYGGNITDDNNNPITPAADDPITDPTTKPEVGDVIVDEDGNPYEITDIDDANTDPDTGEVPIKVKELTDEDDDGIPDKYQVTVEYVSEGASKGTVTGTTEKFPNTPSTTGKYESKISFTATGATHAAAEGFIFSKFVNNENDASNADGKFAFTDVDVNKIITITGKFVAKSYAGNITDENGDPVTPADDDPINDPSTKPEEGDVIVDKDGNPYEITDIDDDNTDPETGEVPIKVKELTDEDGDGIPDKYQVTVKYESADETMGTVTGATEKFPKEKSSKYTDKISFTATGATPKPKAGYAFVEFVNDKDDKTNADGKFAFTDIEVQSTITIKATFVAKDFTNIKDEEGNPIKPKEPLPSDPEPKEGDRFLDENGDPYEITDVGDTNPDTGDTPITVKPVPKNYDDVKDEEGNPVTPKPPFNDDDNKPEKGKNFLDDKGDPYEITEVGPTDPDTGNTPITVKPVPKTYDDVKDEEGNPVKPKEPIGKDDKDPKVGDRFEDENGDEYEITEVGPSDKDGKVPITVGQVMSLTFDLDGGTLQGQTGTFVVKEVKNRSFVIPNEEPTKKGYIFLYWEGSIYYPGDTYKVKDHHKFTAKWIKTAEVGNPNNDGNNSSIISDTENGSGSDAGDGSANKSSSGSKNKSVKTGDESNVALWIALMLISCLGAIGSIAYRRRKD